MKYIVQLVTGSKMFMEATQVGIEDSGVLILKDERGVIVTAFGRDQWVYFEKGPR